MTPQAVRDLLHDLFEWRRAQTGEPAIEKIVPFGADRLAVTFADHTRAVISTRVFDTH